MNASLPELDPVRKEQPYVQTLPPQFRPQPPQPKGGNGLSKLALAVSVLALILSCIALFLVLRPAQETEEPAPVDRSEPTVEKPVTIHFGDRVLTPLEGMPLNSYDRSAFTVDSRGRVSYEKDGKRSKAGVDVSSYQKEIDWKLVAADGIDFAILRLGRRGYTEGGLFMDQTFEANLQGALDAGLEVGVYFFSQAITPEEAEAEASFVLDALGGRKISYPIAFDWEPIAPGNDARTDGLDNDTLTQCAGAFCAKIREAGCTPAVYFNQSLGYLRYDLRELTEYNLWLAEYDTKPDFYYHFDLWQYSATGQVNGIQGNVDLNLDFR